MASEVGRLKRFLSRACRGPLHNPWSSGAPRPLPYRIPTAGPSRPNGSERDAGQAFGGGTCQAVGVSPSRAQAFWVQRPWTNWVSIMDGSLRTFCTSSTAPDGHRYTTSRPPASTTPTTVTHTHTHLMRAIASLRRSPGPRAGRLQPAIRILHPASWWWRRRLTKPSNRAGAAYPDEPQLMMASSSDVA